MSRFFATKSPPLIKYCDEGFNVEQGCNTIRLGTLWGYRREENENLRDVGEGSFHFRLTFQKPAIIPFKSLKTLNLEISDEMNAANLKFVDGGVEVDDIKLSGSANNCWLFCMSREEGSAGTITEAHNSSWKVDYDRIEEFMAYLRGLLWKSLTLADLAHSPLSEQPFSDLSERISIRAEMRQVIYLDRELVITDPAMISPEWLLYWRNSIPFIKPPRFKAEKEVRIAFWIEVDGETVFSPDLPKILQLKPIEKYFQSDW